MFIVLSESSLFSGVCVNVLGGRSSSVLIGVLCVVYVLIARKAFYTFVFARQCQVRVPMSSACAAI